MRYIFSTPATRLLLAGLGLSLGLLSSCNPQLDAEQATPGNANFGRTIAVGNSLTAGYADNGFYREGQLNSYPAILAGQLALAGGGQFRQPLFTEAQANGIGYLRLAGFTATGAPITAQVPPQAVRAITPQPLFTKFTDPIENLGVPGIRLADIHTAGYGSQQGNPLFERITPDANPLQSYFLRVRAEAASATFFTYWLGNNDVLGYATSGGAAQNAANTGLSSPPQNTITRTDSFAARTNRMLALLSAGGTKRGVAVTIPDVTGIPFFTTVGPALKATLTAGNVPGLVVLTGGNPGGAASGNRLQIATADIRDAVGGRQLFTLTAASALTAATLGRPTGLPWRIAAQLSGVPRAGLGTFLTAFGVDTTQAFGASAGNPIPSQFVLDNNEQTLVSNATTAYNAAITTAATSRGIAVFDANGFFRSVSTSGIAANSVGNTAAFVSGNLFSLDGVHPTPRGYAFIANELIKTINAAYGSTVPQVNPNNYRGVLFP